MKANNALGFFLSLCIQIVFIFVAILHWLGSLMQCWIEIIIRTPWSLTIRRRISLSQQQGWPLLQGSFTCTYIHVYTNICIHKMYAHSFVNTVRMFSFLVSLLWGHFKSWPLNFIKWLFGIYSDDHLINVLSLLLVW